MTEKIGANPAAAAWFPEGEAPEGDVSSPTVGRPLVWYGERAAIDVTCLALPCDLALGAAKLVMPDRGLAETMLDHFRSGAADPVQVNLNRELERNARLKEVLANRIEAAVAGAPALCGGAIDESGAIWISQSDYGSGDATRTTQCLHECAAAMVGAGEETEYARRRTGGGTPTRTRATIDPCPRGAGLSRAIHWE
jgi:hypothetical protein